MGDVQGQNDREADEEYVEPPGVPQEGDRLTPSQHLVMVVLLVLIFVVAFFLRLFSVVLYESVIHEFDPHFNFRATKHLVAHDYTEFLDWFDTMAWYPLGRWVGHTVYPGLMATASALHSLLHTFHFTVDIRNVCVFVAPLFAGNTALVVFMLTKECFDIPAALTAAAFMSMAPGYVSRSVAGSYDNEAVAIFALLQAFFCFVRAVNTGSVRWGGAAAVAYGYMVSTWGGYLYLTNLVPLYVLVMLLLGRSSPRLYVAYCVYYIIGTLLSLQVPFVGFSALVSASHAAPTLVFCALQLHHGVGFLLSHLPKDDVIRLASVVLVVGGGLLLAVDMASGGDGRFMVLLSPSKASMIIASVAEHQTTTWASYYSDLCFLPLLCVLGGWYCVSLWSDGSIFLLMYAVTAMYFSAIMIRLVIVLTPLVCIFAGIALSRTLTLLANTAAQPSHTDLSSRAEQDTEERPSRAYFKVFVAKGVSPNAALCLVSGIALLLFLFATHSIWITAESYSSTSIVLRGPRGRLMDDYREAFRWLNQNTPPEARIMSWWDYGYQLASMANRTTLVDNNTWNNTHIATVGRCMSASEEECYRIL
eukprot:Sspe_Gene.13416::Locus_4595_Transcript_1_3_Confidence_0.500_Length_1815::g.13416::m.13416/K07151/STT3; dolichyl-diphosphooligosaccharide--protein glycosyltransferase